jgi:hypothetical protein
MVENLIATIEALNSQYTKEITKFPYQNRRGIWGICFVLWHAHHYHMLSVSNCHRAEPTLADLARSLKGVIHMDETLCGFYDNKKGSLGYYATVQSSYSFDGTDHWYMLARSNDRATLYRMRDSPDIAQDMRDMIDYLEEQGRLSPAQD